MTDTLTRAPGYVDLAVLRLAREIRSEIAESLATRNVTARDDERVDETAAVQVARRLVARSLDQRIAGTLASGEAAPAPGEERAITDLVIAMLFGLGVLQLFVDDPDVENIDANGWERAYVTYADGTKRLVGPVAESDDELIATIRAAGARFGLAERRFDSAQPELDLRLPDGSRLSAVMSVTEHPIVDIRRHRLTDHTLGDLVSLHMLDEELASFLGAAVRSKRNILVSGAMNAGKTTLLRALAAEIPPDERIVTIEQALELGLDRQTERHPDCVAMEARLPNIEGVGAITTARGDPDAERHEPGSVGLDGDDPCRLVRRRLPPARRLCSAGARTSAARSLEPAHCRLDPLRRPCRHRRSSRSRRLGNQMGTASSAGHIGTRSCRCGGIHDRVERGLEGCTRRPRPPEHAASRRHRLGACPQRL